MYRSKGTLTAIDLSEKQLETIKAIILDSKIIDIELDVNDDGRGDMRQVLVFSEPLSNIINKKLIIGDDSLARLTGVDTRRHTSNRCRKDILDNFKTEFPFWCCLGCCKKGKRVVENFSVSSITSCNNLTYVGHFVALFVVLFIVLVILLKRLLPNQRSLQHMTLKTALRKVTLFVFVNVHLFPSQRPMKWSMTMQRKTRRD